MHYKPCVCVCGGVVIKNSSVDLFLSSKAEMQKTIEMKELIT